MTFTDEQIEQLSEIEWRVRDSFNYATLTPGTACVSAAHNAGLRAVAEAVAAPLHAKIAELHARIHQWEEFAEHCGLRLAPDTAAEDVTALRERISELERQLHAATRFLANESLVRENESLKQRISELEADATNTRERLGWILAACEIDRDARHELEGLVQIISEREAGQQKAPSGGD